MKKTLLELGNNFFCETTEDFVKTNPYFAFVLLSAMLEFISRCRNSHAEHQHINGEKEIYETINGCSSLSKYSHFNNGEDKNLLYKLLRCGMLHSLTPDKGLILASDDNNLSNNIVGAQELYHDLHNAWNETKEDVRFVEYLNTIVLVVSENLPG